jgi:hypothetical protein
MTDLIQQIIEIAKNIVHIFDSSILAPLTTLINAIGVLLVKLLELAIMVTKWVFTKI